MSSKVLTGADADAVRAIEWRRAAAKPAPAHLYTEATPPAPEAPGLSEGQKREMEAQVAAAHRRGYQEGEAAANQAAAARINGALEQLARAIEQVAGFRAQLRRQAEADLVRLAIAIARRILRRELSVDSDALTGVARVALDKLAVRDNIRIRVHPAHAPGLSRYMQSAGVQVELVPDPALPPGGLLFETSAGVLDAGVETQFSEIERGLTDMCRRAETGR